MKIKGIICCEESQAITKAFRALGMEVYSNDIKPCTGGHPEWHIRGDAFDAITMNDFTFMIAHPPCTHIAVSGAKHFLGKLMDGRQKYGAELFLRFAQTGIKHWCLENPISVMSTLYREPDQIIQPYFFGDKAQKTTCLWLNGLPKLFHSPSPDLFTTETHVDRGEFIMQGGKKFQAWYSNAKGDRSTARSKTFKGIAEAMAVQWKDFLEFKYGKI